MATSSSCPTTGSACRSTSSLSRTSASPWPRAGKRHRRSSSVCSWSGVSRHRRGIEVELFESPSGGVTARVTLPASALYVDRASTQPVIEVPTALEAPVAPRGSEACRSIFRHLCRRPSPPPSWYAVPDPAVPMTPVQAVPLLVPPAPSDVAVDARHGHRACRCPSPSRPDRLPHRRSPLRPTGRRPEADASLGRRADRTASVPPAVSQAHTCRAPSCSNRPTVPAASPSTSSTARRPRRRCGQAQPLELPVRNDAGRSTSQDRRDCRYVMSMQPSDGGLGFLLCSLRRGHPGRAVRPDGVGRRHPPRRVERLRRAEPRGVRGDRLGARQPHRLGRHQLRTRAR